MAKVVGLFPQQTSVAEEDPQSETPADLPENNTEDVLLSLKAALDLSTVESKEHVDEEKELKNFFRGLQNELYPS